jgi:hypothetical protein
VFVAKKLFPVPQDSAAKLKKEKDAGLGYQFVSVKLKDGRCFEQAVASEGFIIQVKGHKDVPFTPEEIENVTVTGKRWNFRRKREEDDGLAKKP